MGLHVFLPRVTTLSHRRDRKLLINGSLFTGYLFIYTNLDAYSYHEIYKVPGVVQLLNKGSPIPVPGETVDSIRAIGERSAFLPLAGTVGIILGRKDKKRLLIVSVKLFQRSVAVELDSEAVEPFS